jgi:hypothetical protein
MCLKIGGGCIFFEFAMGHGLTMLLSTMLVNSTIIFGGLFNGDLANKLVCFDAWCDYIFKI